MKTRNKNKGSKTSSSSTAKVGKSTPSKTTATTTSKAKSKELRVEVKATFEPKLILAADFLKKVDFLHKNVKKDTEWSAILIYSNHKGTIDDPENWEILVEDLILMDIGSSAYTEYDMEPDDLYATDKWMSALEDGKKLGHLHTHHNMTCYFSGVDTAELHDNAPSHNYYLSLIVNYASTDKWCAKVAVCGTEEATYKVNSITKWKGASGDLQKKDKEEFTEKRDLLFLMTCKIEKAEKEEDISELTDRISEITEINRFKNTKGTPLYLTGSSGIKDPDDEFDFDYWGYGSGAGYKPYNNTTVSSKSLNNPLYAAKNVVPVFIKYLDKTHGYNIDLSKALMKLELFSDIDLENHLEEYFEENCLIEFFEKNLTGQKEGLQPLQMHAVTVSLMDTLAQYSTFKAWKGIDDILALYLMEPDDYSKSVIKTMTGVPEEDQAYLETAEH